jgi:hypothetical protein
VLLDLLALGLLASCALLGAWRGAWAAATALAALVGGYACALAGALVLGPATGAALGLPSLAGGAIAGSGAFLAGALAVGLAGRVLRRAADTRRGEAPRSATDRALGALFGAARGAVLVLLVGIGALWLDAARDAAAPAPAPTPAAADTPLRAATRATLARVVEAAASDGGAGGELALRIATRPAETLAALRRVAASPALAALADDRAFWSDVEAGRADFALARPSFRALADDPAVRRELAAAGAIDAVAARDPQAFRAAARPVLLELGPRLARLRRDPELARLAADPALSDALARRDVLALLLHPGLQRVVSRALAPPPPG